MLFPEPGSWDRKEIYRERRPVKSESLGNSPVSSRWRDSQSFSYRGNYHGDGPREFSRRGVTDYRRPGRGRQQSDWHMFPEESGYGYMPSRSCEKVVEERGYWTPSSRDDGRYRSGADYYKVRGYQKDWEGPGWQQSNSSTAVSGVKPFDGSPVFYGGKPCNGYSDMLVERRHNGMYPVFGPERHFNMSPVISNGRPSNGFSGVSVEKTRNGFSPRNGYSPRNGFSSRNGFSPRNAAESPSSLSPVVSWDKLSLGNSNASIEKTRNGFSRHSVVKTDNRATPNITAERPINLSTRISVDRANDGFSCSPAVKASIKYSPFAGDRSNQIPPAIAKPSFINASVDTLHDVYSDGQAEKKVDCHYSSVSVERPIKLTPSIVRGNSNIGLTGMPDVKTLENISSSMADRGIPYHKPSTTRVSNMDNDHALHIPASNAHKGLAIIPEEKPCISVGVSAINICDGMAGSVVTVPPLVNNDGELSNTEYEPECLRVNTGCLNMWPEISLKNQPDFEPGEIHELVNTPRHDKENFLGADWKPLKWTRSGSLSSCGHSTSSRSITVDSNATIDDSIKIKSTALCSPAAGSADCLASGSSGEAHASKKARLGWGQGLAKYEKKVVDDPCDANQNKICSLKVTSKCTHLVTTTSATCSFLPDTEDKSLKEGNMPDSFQLGFLEPDLISSSFEKLDMSFITTEVHRLLNMVHSDDQYPTGSSSCHESTNALSKLLLWKTGLLKALETTDFEIESFESEIQSSSSGNKKNVHCPAAPTLLQVDSSMVSSSRVEATPQFRIARQDASMNSSHMMVKLTHTCDADTQENHGIHGVEGSRLCDFIFTANKEVAKKASDELAQLLSENETSIANCQEFTNNMLIRDEVAKRKKTRKFSERAATLKYRALQQLWKEDARLLEIRKNRSKSFKRIELGTKTSQSADQKSNLLCSRASSTEGSTKLVPSSQTISLTSNLLSDFPVKVYKDELKMPPLVLDEKETQMSRFVSYNGLVEDPVAAEKERAVMNPWTSDEKETFLDKFAIYGKNFRKIASYLEHKTTADCVDFYYKNHKSVLFERTRKKPVRHGIKSKSVTKASYMLTLGDKWNPECVAADVLAGISGSLTSEVINPCVSSSFNYADVNRQWKRKKVGGKRKRTWTQEVLVKPNNDETCSGESCGEMEFSARDWTDEEKHKLLEAVRLYGNNFELVSKFVKTRYINECKAFYSKVKKRLGSTQKATNIDTAEIRLDIRLRSPLLEPVL